MKQKLLRMTAVAGLLLAGTALAQAPSQPGTGRTEARPRSSQEVRLLYEEVEILRRILDRALIGLPGVLGQGGGIHSMAFSPDGKTLASATSDGTIRVWDAVTGKALRDPHGHLEMRGLQGSYLRGSGAVYSTTLPFLLSQPAHDPTQPLPKPLSEWDRLRKELRGEKVDPEKSAAPAQVSLTETILKVLAENGRHFAQLPENESITVAVTLPRAESCMLCHQPSFWQTKPGASGAGHSALEIEAARTLLRRHPPGEASATDPLAAQRDHQLRLLETESESYRDEVRRQTLLGHTHLKQDQYKQAVDAYQKALEAHRRLLEWRLRAQPDAKGQPPEKGPQAELELADLYNKLAQAYLGQGNREQALKTLQFLGEHIQRVAPAHAARSTPAALPAKLIISAPKKLLDQVGAGKIPFEEFRKAASVEYLDFSAPEKEPARK